MRAPVKERFWAKVDKTDGCWLWTAHCNENGYGYFRLGHKHVRAHRLSWAMANGPIPEGFVVQHKCDVRDCVRPSHLELGSQPENIADMDRKNRRAMTTSRPRDTCHRGHPMVEDNLYFYHRNGRQCRTCKTCALGRANERYRSRKD